jgi:sugar phosphate isomerase/epimerase
MKVGAMNNPKNDLLDEVRVAGEYGFDYLDLTIEFPEATPDKIRASVKPFKDALSTYKLGLVGHMPWFLNIIHPYESIRKTTLEECVRIFDMAAELEIGHITIHPDFQRFRREQKEVIELTVQSLTELSAQARERGLTLCLENFEEDYFSIENLRLIMAQVDGLRFTLDVGHAFMKVKKTDTILKMIGELSPYLLHVHLHDNHGFRDEHLPLGVGTIEVPKIVAGLKQAGYDKTITLEIHADDREYLQISRMKLLKMLS